ncbi:MAG: hypothetical protein COB35_05075 [Gammaproteobacteria bacterium]|nr:MAG: hypothetical protein COB35_05075 [Gammaproteobacteria bacterium]
MNIQAIKNYILDPVNANKNDAAILAELQAFPNTLGEVTDREALNYDADYGLRRKLQYAIDNAPNALADGCIIFLNIVINGRLPSVNIADSSTQNVLNGLVQYGTQLAIAGVSAENIYSQADKDALEVLAMSPSIYNGVQLSDIAVARLSGVQQAHTVTYPIVNLNYLQRNGNQPIRCFVYLDVAAITDTTILIYKQSCASNKDPLVNSNYLNDQQPFGYLTIKTGELGGEFVITKQSAQYLKLMSEADTKQAHSLTLEFA